MADRSDASSPEPEERKAHGPRSMRMRGEDDGTSLKVVVEVGDKTFTIPVGKGNQNMKWLATVVSQRYRMLTKSNGRARQRESQLDPSGFYLPSSVKLHSGEVAFPAVKVKDVMEPGVSINVELTTEYELEEDFSRKQTTWAAMAYNFSAEGRRRAEKKRAADLEAEREAMEEAAREKELEDKKRVDEMSKLLTVDMDNEAAVEEALARDWTHIRMEQYVAEPDDITRIKRTLLKNYVALSDLFRLYSAYHKDGPMMAMCKAEFFHVVLVCKIANTLKDKKDLETIFKAANADRSDDEDPSAAMYLTRFEFFEALLALAHLKYSKDTRGDRGLSMPDAVDRLMDIHILPRVAKMQMGKVRSALHSQEIIQYIAALAPRLHRVFDFYKTLDSDVSLPENDASINFKEFSIMLADARLASDPTKGSSHKEELSAQEVREVFNAVQREDEATESKGAASPTTRRGEEMQSMQELVWSEFLEAIARIGVEKWEDDEVPVKVRMKMALDCVAMLDQPGGVGPVPRAAPMPSPDDYMAPPAAAAGGAGAGTTPFITQGGGVK